MDENSGDAKTFIKKVKQAYVNQDGPLMTQLFTQLYKEHKWDSEPTKWESNFAIEIMQFDNQELENSLNKMLEAIRKYQAVKLSKGVVYAFKFHMEVLSAALRVFETVREENIWICRPTRQVIRATKSIFLEASKKVQEISTDITIKKDDLVNALQRYKTSRNIKEDMIKREIGPLVDNMQVSIMFVYHNYEQIRRILESNKSYGEHGLLFEDNYYFQRGKVALINQRMIEAQAFFQKIKLRTSGQKRLVLKYLIPCKMFLGKMFEPTEGDPDEYFPEYQLIVSALINADFSLYDKAMEKYQKLWIKRGIFLVMDELRINIWRNLIKKVSKVMGIKINIQVIAKAVKKSNGFEEMGEIICILSNLIHEGYVKGYIFQDDGRKVLVLSKNNPFPPLSTIYS